MRWLLIQWHRWCLSTDSEELRLRIEEGSASDAWAVNTMTHINWRERRIEQLSAS